MESASYREGFAAGAARQPRDNPYVEAEGEYDFSNWEIGYDSGRKIEDARPSSTEPA